MNKPLVTSTSFGAAMGGLAAQLAHAAGALATHPNLRHVVEFGVSLLVLLVTPKLLAMTNPKG